MAGLGKSIGSISFGSVTYRSTTIFTIPPQGCKGEVYQWSKPQSW